MRKENSQIEEILNKESKSWTKEKVVYTMANISYSLITGTALDFYSGLSPFGVLCSRTYATGINSLTGALYENWRNYVFRKKDKILNSKPIQYLKEMISKTRLGKLAEKNWIRKTINATPNIAADLFAFNTMQVPIYASAIALGTFISEGKINWESVQNGAENLAKISPIIGPTMGWYNDRFRKFFGVQTAEEKSREPDYQLFKQNKPQAKPCKS